MSITLSPELEKQIREKVEAGLVSSVQAFVEGAVRNALGDDESWAQRGSRRAAADVFDEIWERAPEEAVQRLPQDGSEQVDH